METAMAKMNRFLLLILIPILLVGQLFAQEKVKDLKLIDATEDSLSALPVQVQEKLVLAEPMPNRKYENPLNYTLGPDDVLAITVMRHPEFSGTFPVNLEGKIQFKYLGDVEVTGLTKKDLEQRLRVIISGYLVNPEVTITILEYKSKVIYVLGEVAQPGKYYMRSESVPVREALVQAGLPLQSAAMRKGRIITPDKNNKVKIRSVDLYSILYGGNLKYNLDMHPGDVLYVPCTIMAKLIRMINPVTATVSGAAGTPSGISTGRGAVSSLAK